MFDFDLATLGVQHFALFLSSTLIFALTPGIDTVFVLNKAIANGKKIGALSALGVAVGVLVHTVLASLGLATIVAKSALLFAVIKYLGAGYLVYLGLSSMYHAIKNPTALEVGTQTSPKVVSGFGAFRSGLFTNVLNPKVALFFLAFFPQFITPSMMGSAMPYLVLGSLYALISAVWLVALALLAGSVLSKILTSVKAKRNMDFGSGLVFVGMGAKVALSK